MPHRTTSAPPASAAIPSQVLPLPPVENPRVQVVSSPNGTVLIVGVTLSGDWVADYRCRVEDFDELCVRRMEQKVREKERHLPTRVLEFPPR